MYACIMCVYIYIHTHTYIQVTEDNETLQQDTRRLMQEHQRYGYMRMYAMYTHMYTYIDIWMSVWNTRSATAAARATKVRVHVWDMHVCVRVCIHSYTCIEVSTKLNDALCKVLIYRQTDR